MTKEVATKEEKKLDPKPEIKFEPWSKEEKETSKTKYACEILVSNGTLADVHNTQTPSDAFIVKYVVEDKTILDLTRGSKSKIFDMYWDKFKSGLKSIDYGNGSIKPNLWGYQAPKTKGKKRK